MAETTTLPNLHGVELPPMPVDDAARFLQKISLRADGSQSIETCVSIAERLGCLPLAIVQMGHLIRSKHLSLTEFIEYYDYDSKKFHEMPFAGYTKQQTIAFVWNIESLSPVATALLQVLSVLDSNSIPEEILMTGAKKVDLKDYPSERPAYFEAREALLKSSLVTRNTSLGILRIHRLVQDVVRHKLSLPLFRDVFNAGTVLLSAVWPFIDNKNLNNIDRLRKVQRYQPQITMLRSVPEGRAIGNVKPLLMIAALFNEASWTYQLAGTGYRFDMGDEYAVLAQEVIELSEDEQDSVRQLPFPGHHRRTHWQQQDPLREDGSSFSWTAFKSIKSRKISILYP